MRRVLLLLLLLLLSLLAFILVRETGEPEGRTSRVASRADTATEPAARYRAGTTAGVIPSPGMPSPVRPPAMPAATGRPVAVGMTVVPVRRGPVEPPTDRVRRIIDNQAAYRDRLIAIRSLGNDLSQEEGNALLDFLYRNADAQSDLDPLAFNAIKNDVLDALIRTKPMPEGLGAAMIEMYRDLSMDATWRDYCVQHFALYYDEKWPPGSPAGEAEPSDEAEPEQARILDAFAAAMEERGGTIAGTALIGLAHLAAGHARQVPPARVAAHALAVANDASAGEAARLTALQVCVQTGARGALPAARLLAQTGESVATRLSAVATLGEIGEEQDRELLRSLAADADRRVAAAAGKAATRLGTGGGR